MKPYNPFAECIERGREHRERMKREKYILHKKFLKCFPCVTDKEGRKNHRHPNVEMI